MSGTLTYKGFSTRVELDAEGRIFVGRIAGIRDVIGFHAATISGLEKAFREAVNDYANACAKLGQSPTSRTAAT